MKVKVSQSLKCYFSRLFHSSQDLKISRNEPTVRRLSVETLESRNLLTVVTLSATDSVASETGTLVGGVPETPDYAEICISRSDSETSATIGLKLSGEAGVGDDYSLWLATTVGNEVRYTQLSTYGPYFDSESDSSFRTCSFTINANESSATLQLRPTNDSSKETVEQATLTLNYYVSGPTYENLSGSCSVTINDNDDWTVTPSATDASATEAPAGSEDYAIVTFTRSGETDVSLPLSVSFKTYASAGSGDYTLQPVGQNGALTCSSSHWNATTQLLEAQWAVTIPAGSASVDVLIRPINDEDRELTENMTFTVLPSGSEYGFGAYAASETTADVAIYDNDNWTISVSAIDATASETPVGSEDYATVTFTRSGETDLTHASYFTFATYGDAGADEYDLYLVELDGNDEASYSQLSSTYSRWDDTIQQRKTFWNINIPADKTFINVQLRPINDPKREQDEDVTFEIVPCPVEYGYRAYVASTATATTTIEDNDDWVVSIVATDPDAAEAPSGALDPGVFTVSRTNETDYTYPLQVRFRLTGTADYPYSEDFALTGPTAASLTLTEQTDSSTGEHYYDGTLTIPAGYSSVDLYVRPRNDQKREETETAIATLQISLYVDPENNLPPYTLGATEATVSIADNDQWTVAIDASDVTVAEEDSAGVHYGSYTITRTGETDLTYPLRVFLQTTGTANSADFSVWQLGNAGAQELSLTPKLDATTGDRYYSWSVQIPAGSTSVSVEVRPVDDRDAESAETIVTAIQAYENYLIDSSHAASTITIEEETTVTLTVVDSVALEPCTWITPQDRRAQYRLEVTTTETNWNNITVHLNVSGTATPGNNGSTGDYHLTKTPVGGVSSDVVTVNGDLATIVIPGGQNSLDFYAMPNGDYDFEIDEEILLTIAQAFSRSTANQVEHTSEDESVVVLQAPEFLSGDDPSVPLVINADSYSRFVNPSAENNSLFGGRETVAVVPDGRSVRYFFYDETLGNSGHSFETDPLLAIDEETGVIVKLRPMTESEAESPLTFTIKACDSEYNQLYDLASLTLSAVEFSMTPYTPQTTYFNPMPIPDNLWKTNKVGIRRNTDRDNGGSDLDSQFTGTCSAENDLIRVKVNFDHTISGITYSICRSNSDLKIWRHSDKSGGEYVFTNNECVLVGGGSIWVEYASSGNQQYTLTLVARDSTTNETLYTEDMIFRPFESVTCAFVGEFEIAGNCEASPGINDWVVSQLLNGYDVHVWDDGFDEFSEARDCTPYGEGRALDEIANAINNRGVKNVALIGYSHGGGSVYNLSRRMFYDGQTIIDPVLPYFTEGVHADITFADRINKPYTLVFTSYIDAVPNNFTLNGILGASVCTRPLGSAFHTNQYQTRTIPNGCSIPESDDNLNRSYLHLEHSNTDLTLSIDTNEIVVKFLTTRFQQKVTR